MKVLHCDRCDAVNSEETDVNEFVFMAADGKGREEWDLCVSCRNQLQRFFNGDLLEKDE